MDRNDDDGEGSKVEISIFTYPAREFGYEIRRILTDIKIWQAEIYILLNMEIDPYVE